MSIPLSAPYGLTFVTGGARSGKSQFAEHLAAQYLAAQCSAAQSGGPVTYLATAQALDGEMQQRIARHRAQRPQQWHTVEEALRVVQAARAAQGTLLLDCLSLWVSNLMLAGHTNAEVLTEVEALLEALAQRGAPSIIVSNEVGSGVVPAHALGRRYRDLLGWANARCCARAGAAYLLVAGRPVPLPAAPSCQSMPAASHRHLLSPEPTQLAHAAPPPLQLDMHALAQSIAPTDQAAMQAALERQANLTKPAGALGELEALSVRLAGVFGPGERVPTGAAVLVAVADHGVAAEGVSAYPQEVTGAMLGALLTPTPAGLGSAAINAIARSVGAEVYVLDAGVKAEVPDHPALRRATTRRGTRNLLHGAAMTREELAAAVEAGAALARGAVAAGADFVVAGELGIGNTTAAACITARLLGASPEEVTGRGTGVDDAGLRHKQGVVAQALARSDAQDPLDVLAEFGGYEIAAMLGMMLQAAALRRAVVLDGFVEGSAALVGVRLAPHLRGYLFAAGQCAERGHAAQLRDLGLTPLFRLGLRLGEGTGGALAVPMLRAAGAVLREMQTFEEAGVPR